MEDKITTIDQYISQYSGEVKERMEVLRQLIKTAAPQATVKISWGMPTFVLHGNLVHFAAHKNHIGFYPSPSGITAFAQELKDYKTSKGSIQFPHNKPLPTELIKNIVLFRVNEQTAK